MYLIDTSIWIDYFTPHKKNTAITKFTQILDQNLPFGLTEIICEEILQGANSEKDFETLAAYLSTQRFFYPKKGIQTYKAAAKLYFDCRKKGITIRSTIDCLIAQIAIENQLVLVHNDIDFSKIAHYCKELQLL